jgi:outer membrane protein assembly factor BamB
VNSSPAVADGKVYVGSQNKLYALNATTGALIWSYEAGNWVRSSPAVAEGILYVGSDDNKLYAFGTLPTPTFTLTTNSTTVFLGGFFKLNGTLSIPKTSPPNITLQWSKDGSGFIYQQTTFNIIANGVYIRDIAFTAAGTYQFRAVWPGDATSSSATSNIVTVTVLDVIPEFPPILMLPLVITLTLSVAVLLRKRKQT